MNGSLLINRLNYLEKKHQHRTTSESGLRVYYGWAKTGKVRKREAISVIYENQPGAGEHHRIGKTLRKLQHTVFYRLQTDKEAEDAKGSIRVFTEYSIFLDDKKIGNSLAAAIHANYEADKNNVSKEIRDEIAGCLRKWFMEKHPDYLEKPFQLEIMFND